MLSLTGRSVFECLSSWAISWVRPRKIAVISSDVSFLQDFCQPYSTTTVTVANCCLYSQEALANWESCLEVGPLWRQNDISSKHVCLSGESLTYYVTALQPHWLAHCDIRSLSLQFGGQVLSGKWEWQWHPIMWAQQMDPLHSLIVNSQRANTFPLNSNFSFIFLLFPSFLLFHCFFLVLTAQQSGVSMCLHNQELHFIS